MGTDTGRRLDLIFQIRKQGFADEMLMKIDENSCGRDCVAFEFLDHQSATAGGAAPVDIAHAIVDIVFPNPVKVLAGTGGADGIPGGCRRGFILVKK